jgi:hypothetical protein
LIVSECERDATGGTPLVSNRKLGAGSKMSALKDTNDKLSDDQDSVDKAHTMNAWPRLSAEALHRIESVEADAISRLRDQLRPYTAAGLNWTPLQYERTEATFRAMDYICDYASTVFDANAAEYLKCEPAPSVFLDIIKNRIVPLVGGNAVMKWGGHLLLLSTSEPPSRVPRSAIKPSDEVIPIRRYFAKRHKLSAIVLTTVDHDPGAQPMKNVGDPTKAFIAKLEALMAKRGEHWTRELQRARSTNSDAGDLDGRAGSDPTLTENVPPRADGANLVGTGWQAIEVSFLSDERVQIRNGTSIESRNYGELGFADRRAKHGNPKPNQAWVTLRVMAEQKGVIRDAAKTGQDWPKVEKRVQEIRKVFRKHFGITADPIPFVAGTGYQALFKIGCGPSYQT